MNSQEYLIICKGCKKSFRINGILTHIRQASCKNQFTSAEYNHLVQLCDSHRRKKSLERKAENYRQRKRQKKVKV